MTRVRRTDNTDSWRGELVRSIPQDDRARDYVPAFGWDHGQIMRKPGLFLRMFRRV